MYKKLLLLIITICAASFSIAQSVGINTNDPTATLDIEATNPAAPDSTTGILIPRIDAFPLSNPSIDQNGMMVFLTTDNKFYFWNNATLTWVPVQTGIDLDNDPSNELQALDFSGTTLGISDGNTVSLSSIGGDITSVTAGAGITGGGTAGTVTVTANANNGLNVDAGADRIQLGGALTENTTITQGTNTMDFTTTEVDGFSVDGATFSVDGTNNRIGIGTASPNSTMQIVNSTTTNSLNIQSTSAAVVGQVLNIQRTNDPSPANDILQITTPSTSPDDFQFLEFDRGGNVEFAVDGDGDVEFNGALEPNGAPGTSGQFLRSAGTNASPTWATIPGFNGDITGITAGAGLTGGGPTGAVTVTANANNGLYVNAGADRIRMGGALVENTTITQANFSLTNNLTGTGDFRIQDVGTTTFEVRDDGTTRFGDDVYWSDANSSGTILGVFSDDGDDGRFRMYENGAVSMDLDMNSHFIFNEQGFDRNFRVESDANENMLFVDASANTVGIGTSSPLVDLHIVGSPTMARQIIAPSETGSEDDSELVFGEDIDATFGMKFTYDGGDNKLFLRGFNSGYTVDNTPHLTVYRDNGNVGIGTTTPGQKLDVAGTTTTDGLQVGTGSTFTNMQGGTATIGAGTSVRVITVTFPTAFTSIPKVICTPRTQTGQSYTDTFSATTKQISTTQFQVNIQRVDSGGGWGQNLLLDWFAFSN